MRKLVLTLSLIGVFTATQVRAQQTSQCMKDYKTLRIVNGVKVGLTPPAGIGTLAGSAYLSFCFEYCVGWRAAINGVLGAAGNTLLNTVLPLGVVGAFVGLQTFHTVRYVQSARAHKLLKDAFGLGKGKRLGKVTKKVAKYCPSYGRKAVAAEIRKLDASKELCNGSIVRGLRRTKNLKRRKKLRKRVAFEKDIVREVRDICDPDVMVVKRPSGVVKVRFKDGTISGSAGRIHKEEINAELGISKGSSLKLRGHVKGKYENGLIDFEGGLTLREKFEYKQGKVKSRLKKGGTITVKVEKSEFKEALLGNIQIEVKIKRSGSRDLKLDGNIENGKYQGGKVSFNASIKLKRAFTYKRSNGQSVRVDKGTVFEYRLSNGLIEYIKNDGLKIDLTDDDDDDDDDGDDD